MDIARSFYFIRHGQTDWNVEKKLQGSNDIPLNDTGREQARAAIPYFKDLGIDLIVSSPLKRAYETSQIISDAISVSIEVEKDLHERDCGSGEGHHYMDFKKEYEKEPNKNFYIDEMGFYSPVDAEPFDVFKKRIFKAIDTVLKKHPNKTVLISGHGIFFEALRFALFGEHIMCDNGVPYYLEKKNDGSWTIEKVSV